jgi:hypothetical protein
VPLERREAFGLLLVEADGVVFVVDDSEFGIVTLREKLACEVENHVGDALALDFAQAFFVVEDVQTLHEFGLERVFGIKNRQQVGAVFLLEVGNQSFPFRHLLTLFPDLLDQLVERDLRRGQAGYPRFGGDADGVACGQVLKE